jgi:hypothetical protein
MLPTLTFDGVTGDFKVDGTETDIAGRVYIAFIPRCELGFIRFHGPGVQPDVEMRNIGDERGFIYRDSLPDGHATTLQQDGTRRLDWGEQIILPVADMTDDAGDLLCFVARSKTAVFAVSGLLTKFRYHVKARQGLLPLIKFRQGSYINKKLGGMRKAKPEITVCGWVQPDGTTPKPPKNRIDFNDEIPV